MKVILLKAVKNLGEKGRIVEVKEGYASFLISSKSAVIATSTNVNLEKTKQENIVYRSNVVKHDAQILKEQIEKIQLNVSAKDGKDGKMFGSITSKQVEQELLKQHGITVDRKKINVDGLTSFGLHSINISLGHQVVAILKINIMVEAR